MKCGYPLLVNDINAIIKEKEKIKKHMTSNNLLKNSKIRNWTKKEKRNQLKIK